MSVDNHVAVAMSSMSTSMMNNDSMNRLPSLDSLLSINGLDFAVGASDGEVTDGISHSPSSGSAGTISRSGSSSGQSDQQPVFL